MITNSFVFLKNISTTREASLWRNGILTWHQFIQTPSIRSISDMQKQEYDAILKLAEKHYRIQNHEFFTLNLPAKEHWRMYPMLKEKCCFLDIETTGLDKHRNRITTIAVYDPAKKRTKVFINGQNLTRENLIKELENYAMVVTYNGDQFDLPFMEHHFSLGLNYASFDLRWAGRRVELTGGLKSIEKQLNITRGDDVEGVDGREAVRLWKKWELNGDKEALDTLVLYNSEDVIHLKTIADIVYSRLQESSLGRYLNRPRKDC
jgi:uncharacterized protein YprB with RNaseH-like and TPR domain